MKIYWKYGKEINVLLYIDRIIFIKIHIHVQELAWSRVLCESLLAFWAPGAVLVGTSGRAQLGSGPTGGGLSWAAQWG